MQSPMVLSVSDPAPPMPVLSLRPAALLVNASNTPAFARVGAPGAPPWKDEGGEVEVAAGAAARGAFFYMQDMAGDVFKPLSLKRGRRGDLGWCLGLSAVAVAVVYSSVPGLSEAAPFNSTQGAVYLSLLASSAIFATCLVMAMGRAMGRMLAHGARACARRSEWESQSSTLPNL